MIERHGNRVAVLEVEPQTLWFHRRDDEPPFVVDEAAVARLDALPGARLVHSVGTPVGGTVGPDPAQLELLNTLIERWHAPWASEHLAFNRTRVGGEDLETGFLLAPRITAAGADTAARSIRRMADAVSVPVAVETGVNYLQPRPEELDDGAFLRAVVERADCGLLLDLHNVWANERNGRQPVSRLLEQIPLEAVWEVHLAGGFEHRGFWLDAHSGAIPGELLEVAGRVLPRLPNLRALLFEVVPSGMRDFGPDNVARQLDVLWDLWESRGDGVPAAGPLTVPRRAHSAPAFEDGPSPREWEETLGSLVAGRPAHGRLARELAGDPGVQLLRELVAELRASSLVGTLKLTCRLLVLSLGEEGFGNVLAGYRAKVTPRLFASEEAAEFGRHLREVGPNVHYLREVLAFELAVVATLADGIPRTTRFPFEPISVLRALGEGRLPQGAGEGIFDVEVTGEEPSGDLSDYLARASYWPH